MFLTSHLYLNLIHAEKDNVRIDNSCSKTDKYNVLKTLIINSIKIKQKKLWLIS